MTVSILVINPGSTSTKLALFSGREEICSTCVNHSAKELGGFKTIMDQADFRLDVVREFLESNGIDVKSLDAVAGRGGLLKPVPGGVYRVDDAILEDLRSARYGEHAGNLGAVLADIIAGKAGCEAYIADPVVVDELFPEARLTGVPTLERKSIFHALNQKAAAREAAKGLGKKYEECDFIVAHLGGGISVGAHRRGKVIDVNNALDGDGPFSPERAGTLPAGQLVDLCFSGHLTRKEIRHLITGGGGLSAYNESNRLEDLLGKIDAGNKQARVIYSS